MATAFMFPWSVDPQGDQSFQPASRSFYDKAYSSDPQTDKDDIYKDSAERATLITSSPKIAADFVDKYGLKNKKVLEVGAGSGLLQDIVDDYTALEISKSARRFFHKPFVEASATNMPFPDNSFDALWTFRVLEHIPNPEKALLEYAVWSKQAAIFCFILPMTSISMRRRDIACGRTAISLFGATLRRR